MNGAGQRPAARAGLNHSIQTNQDEYGQEEDGVRPAMEYQQDQLVGGGDERVGLLGVTPAQLYALQ